MNHLISALRTHFTQTQPVIFFVYVCGEATVSGTCHEYSKRGVFGVGLMIRYLHANAFFFLRKAFAQLGPAD
jgi:hypothetical protein